MDPILDKAREQQRTLERIMNAIPGFKGYREKELRRDADKAQREYLAARLEEVKKQLNDSAAALTRSGGLDGLNDVETARTRLDKVVARIRYADRGYAGFFDTVKVDEAMLDRVYQFDLSLLQDVERVRDAASGPDLKPLIAAIDAADARLAERESVLSGVR